MMNYLKKINRQVLALASIFFLAMSVLAPTVLAQVHTGETSTFQGIRNEATGDLGNNPTLANSGGTFLYYFVTIWRVVINIGALLVIVNFLWGAIDWITAGGDSGKIQKARDKITQSIIGLVLLVGSFVIIAFIGKVLFGDSFKILDLAFPTAQEMISTSVPAGAPAPLGPGEVAPVR